MALKASDYFVGVLILTFVVGLMTTLINLADESTSVDSGYVIESLQSFGGNLSETPEATAVLSQSLDNTSEFTVDADQQLETRGAETGGIINLLGRNILTNFIINVGKKLQIPKSITKFAIILFSVLVMFALVRTFFGENRI